MCILCIQGKPQDHTQLGRRNFLKASTATAAAASAAGMGLFAARPASAHDDDAPEDSGKRGRRYVIRGGHVMTMDPSMPNKGEFAQADVLVEGKKILAVGPNLHAGGAAEIDARGKIVMPGFVDTHHHQFETALRSFLADGLLFNDGLPHGTINYFQYILGTFAGVYRPEDVYISELFGSLSQLDAGVTTSHDISQIHYTQQHSVAAIKGSADSGRRIVFGFFEGARADLLGSPPGAWYPGGANELKEQYFSSSDQLMTMTMGGEIYLLPNNPGDPRTYETAWKIGRQLQIPIAAHIVGSFGMGPEFDAIARGERSVGFGPDNLFIHMTGMSDLSWQKMQDVKKAAEDKGIKNPGPHVSLAVPI